MAKLDSEITAPLRMEDGTVIGTIRLKIESWEIEARMESETDIGEYIRATLSPYYLSIGRPRVEQ